MEAGLIGESGGASRNIQVELPDDQHNGWLGAAWLLLASFPAAIGGGTLHPAINSLITQSSGPGETGGMLGISASFYSAANALAPLVYGSLFEWFGSTTPFLLGGLLLVTLWLLAPKLVQKKGS